MIEEETWKPVVGYEGLYEVSDSGRVRKCTEPVRVLRVSIYQAGYAYVWLRNGESYRPHYVHRLVARAFLGEPVGDRDEVNHIDGNKHNTRVENLEWVSHRENARHASATGLQTCSKPVIQMRPSGEIVGRYFSAAEAIRQTAIKNVWGCCLGKRRTAGGFVWRYADEMKQPPVARGSSIAA